MRKPALRYVVKHIAVQRFRNDQRSLCCREIPVKPSSVRNHLMRRIVNRIWASIKHQFPILITVNGSSLRGITHCTIIDMARYAILKSHSTAPSEIPMRSGSLAKNVQRIKKNCNQK